MLLYIADMFGFTISFPLVHIIFVSLSSSVWNYRVSVPIRNPTFWFMEALHCNVYLKSVHDFGTREGSLSM